MPNWTLHDLSFTLFWGVGGKLSKHASQTSSWESCLAANVGSFWCLKGKKKQNKTTREHKACVLLVLEEVPLCILYLEKKKIPFLMQSQKKDWLLVFLFFRFAQQHCTSVPLKYSTKLLLMYFSQSISSKFLLWHTVRLRGKRELSARNQNWKWILLPPIPSSFCELKVDVQ